MHLPPVPGRDEQPRFPLDFTIHWNSITCSGILGRSLQTCTSLSTPYLFKSGFPTLDCIESMLYRYLGLLSLPRWHALAGLLKNNWGPIVKSGNGLRHAFPRNVFNPFLTSIHILLVLLGSARRKRRDVVWSRWCRARRRRGTRRTSWAYGLNDRVWVFAFECIKS